MPTTIESLELEVQSSSTSAVNGIDALSASLSKLKIATKGGVGLRSVANQLRDLNTALKGVDASSVDKVDKLATSLSKLQGLGNLKLSSSIGNQLKNIGSAATSLNGVDFSGITKMSNALSSLGSIGNASGLKSAITQLGKIPALAQTLNGVDWTTFTRNIQAMSNALTPLVNQLNSVSTAFNRLPSNIRNMVSATNNLTRANNSAANSYMNFWAKARMAYNAVRVGARMIASWITESNSYIENLNLFNVSMGKYAEEAQAYANQVAEIMGIDPGEWMRNQGVFMTITEGFGVASDRAYIMSKNLTQLGYDLSSFFNISYEDAMQKLTSGISGELEPLRRLGYDLSEARLKAEALSLGITKSFNSMTQAEKAQIRYYAIMTQVTSTQGDMARTLNAPANQLRILKAQVTQCARALGNIFIPVLNAVLPYAIALAKVIRILANSIASLFGFKLPEVDYSSLTEGAGIAGDIEDGLGGATEAAKDLKNAMLGIDELNIISPTDASGAGGGSGIAGGGDLGFELPEYDFLGDAIDSRVNDLVEKFKEWLGITGEINSWSDLFKTRLGEIVILVAAIGAGIAAWKVMGLLKSLGIITGGLKTMLGVSLAVGSSVAFIGESINAWVNGLDIDNFFGMIASGGGVIGGLALAFGSLAAGIGAAVTGLVGFVVGIKDAITNGLNLLNGVLIPLSATVSGAGIGAIIGSLGGPIRAAGGALIGLVVGLLIDLGIAIAQNWDSIAQWAKETGKKIKKWFDDRVEDVKAFPGEVVKAFKSFPKKLEQGLKVVSDWLDTLPGKISQWFSDLASDIDEWFDELWQPIKDYDWNGLGYNMGQWFGNAVKSAINFVTVTIPSKISELTESIKKALKNFFTVSLPYFFNEWLPDVVQSVADFFLELPDKLGAVITSIWEGLKEVGSSIWEGVLEGLGAIWEGITEWVDGLVEGFCDALGINSPSTVFRDQIGIFLAEGILEGLLEPFKKIGEWIKKNIIDPIVEVITRNPIENLKIGVELFKSGWKTVKEWIGNLPIISQAISLLKSGWTTVKNWIGNIPTLSQAISLLKSGWTTVKNWIGNIPTLSQGISLLKSGWTTVKNWIGTIPVLSQGISLLKSGWTTVKNWVGTIPVLSQGISLLKSGWTSVKNWIGTLPVINQGISLFKSGWSSLSSWIGTASSVGISLWRNGWSSISSWIGTSVSVGISLFKSGWSSIKSFFGLADGGIVGANGGVKMFASGGTINSMGRSWWDSIPKYAGGTTKAHGSMFVAGEDGAELVGHVNGTTEVLNRFQLAQVMHSSIVAGMAQFTGYWRSMVGQMTTCANGIIRAVMVGSNYVVTNVGTVDTYDPANALARTVFEDSQRAYKHYSSDDSMYNSMRDFYREYVEPTLKEIASDAKRQADKEEQTIVQIGNRTVNDAVVTQQKANGYVFAK